MVGSYQWSRIFYNCPTNFSDSFEEQHSNFQTPVTMVFLFLSNDEIHPASEIQTICFKELNLELLLLREFLDRSILGKASADCEPKMQQLPFHDPQIVLRVCPLRENSLLDTWVHLSDFCQSFLERLCRRMPQPSS